MKLSPPGSSSDLEAARAIARRLHQRAFASDSNALAPARHEPWEVPPPAHDPLPLPSPRPSPAGGPGPVRPASPSVQEARRPDPEPVAELDLEVPASEPELDLGPSLPDIDAEAPAPWEEPPAAPSGAPWDPGQEASGAEPEGALAELTEDGGASPERISAEDLVNEPTASEGDWSELPAVEGAGDNGPDAPAESLVEIPGPSWDDLAEKCRGQAHARAAMLVDAGGQVLSARGDWPNPGPEAIAGRLVAMMERALRDAPTRSVSAPLAGQHLTAWRVPVSGALLTAVFMGDAPLRADVRPAIDQEIARSAES
jgi:hypothetical protein